MITNIRGSNHTKRSYRKLHKRKQHFTLLILLLAFTVTGCQYYHCPAVNENGNLLTGKEKVKSKHQIR